MFSHVGRNLILSVFKTTSVHRLCSRSLCSSPAASDNSFAVSYLIDSCSFPLEKAISTSRYLKFKTPDRADSVMAFFKHQGFTENQSCRLVRSFPKVLTYHPEKNLLPKFNFLSSTGLSDSDIYKVFTTRPKFLGSSLKNYIEPNYNSIRDLLQCNDRTVDAIRRCAWVLDREFQANLIPNMQILRDVGVPGSKMLRILTCYPRGFSITTERFKKSVEEVVKMGFDPLKTSFMLAVHVLRSISKSIWKKKMETYKKWGWSEAEILLAFRTKPWCMTTSDEKIDKVMDYLVNKMGLETSIVAKNSALLFYSLEKRTIPRCLVYQYCLDNRLMKDKNHFGFIWWLSCSGNVFLKKIGKI